MVSSSRACLRRWSMLQKREAPAGSGTIPSPLDHLDHLPLLSIWPPTLEMQQARLYLPSSPIMTSLMFELPSRSSARRIGRPTIEGNTESTKVQQRRSREACELNGTVGMDELRCGKERGACGLTVLWEVGSSVPALDKL